MQHAIGSHSKCIRQNQISKIRAQMIHRQLVRQQRMNTMATTATCEIVLEKKKKKQKDV